MGVDFSPISQRALDYAIKLAENFEARLYLLHIIAPVMPSLYVVDTRIEATIQKQVNRDMLKLVKLARGSGVEAEPR